MDFKNKNSFDGIIESIFSKSVKEPCFYQLQFKNKTIKELFKIILEIYKKGIQLLFFPKQEEIVISNLTERMVFKMKLYMNSMGFDPNITTFDKDTVESLAKDFNAEVNNPDISVYAVNNKKFNFPKILIAMRKTNNTDKIKQYSKDLARSYKRYPKMRLLFMMYNKKTKLDDYMVNCYDSDKLHVLIFDYAKYK